MKKSYLLFAVFLCAVFVLSGCSLTDSLMDKAGEKVAEEAIETMTNSELDADFNDGTISINSEEGSVSIGGTEIPDDFPSDVPVYANAEVVWTSFSSGDETYWIDFESTDDYTEIKAYYDAEIESNGWEVYDSSTYTSDGQETTLYSADRDNRTLIVTLSHSESENKTMISVSTTTEQE
ncbi:MAG: hypothetical protein ABID45_03150 [Patescibacteria group bacterium]